MAKGRKHEFNNMSSEVSAGLGPGRSSAIHTLVHTVTEGYCSDVEGTIETIAKLMSEHDQTRDRQKDIVLNPEDPRSWKKIGVPGGPDRLREIFRVTPRKEPQPVPAPRPSVLAGLRPA